jgi:hypothetical protein
MAATGGGQGPSDAAVSMAAADSLGEKIAQILAVEPDSTRPPAADTIIASEIEMESFVVFWMEEDIPPKVESIDVTVGTGRIRAVTELVFDEEQATGNPLVDAVLLGTHRLALGGMLSGAAGRGTFELEEVRVDGIPVPLAFIDLLVTRFVKPNYPDVDLDAPFDLPWGIETVELVDGHARIAY